MNAQSDETQWNALQALVEEAMPEDNWMLHRLETGVDTQAGADVVQAVLQRVRLDGAADQVLGSGATPEDAVRAAIQMALHYPELPDESEADRFDGTGDPWISRAEE